MIHEFAVEPEVMATWEHFNVLWDDFGVSCGRLLVEFPGSWRKQVIALADQRSKPVRANSIKSKVCDQGLRLAKLVGADGRQPDGSDWQASAVRQQCGSKPFRAVIASSNFCERADVLVAGEFERDAEPWKVPRQDSACLRTREEMGRRINTLLHHSEQLKLVDRNFDPCEPRFSGPFEAFVGVRSCWKRLEVHAALPLHYSQHVIQANYRRALELAVPTGTTLQVFLWPGLPEGDRMHPRFVLTERGGVYFDYGLDEGQSPFETTLVTLLEHEVFIRQWEDFSESGTKFGKPERVIVQGRG